MTRARPALGVALLLCLAGCTSQSVPDDPSPRPSASTRPSGSPSSSASPEPTASASPSASPGSSAAPDAADATCADLLDAPTTQRFADLAATEGFVFDPTYPEYLVSSGDPLAVFVEAGGLACLWGKPNTDYLAELAWARLEADAAAALREDLTGGGYTTEIRPEGDLVCAPVSEDAGTGHDPCFLFGARGTYFASYKEQLPMLVTQVAAL